MADTKIPVYLWNDNGAFHILGGASQSYCKTAAHTFAHHGPTPPSWRATCYICKKRNRRSEKRLRRGLIAVVKPEVVALPKPKRVKVAQPKKVYVKTVDFLKSREWAELRYQALKASDGKCQCCGASKATGAILHVDHIKPRSKHPELARVLSNLQVLCAMCNRGKSNKDMTDWRHP